MNAQLLKPAVQDLFDFFKGEQRVKVEVEFTQNVDGSEYVRAYAFVGLNDDLKVYSAETADLAVARAKIEFKPIDRARLAAADKLREQASAIERGEIEIPK